VIKENINENNRKAAKTLWMIFYSKSTECILRIRPSQNEYQWSVNNFRSCKSGDSKLFQSWFYMIKVLATFIGNNYSDMLPTPSWQWVSMERQWCLVLHPGYSERRIGYRKPLMKYWPPSLANGSAIPSLPHLENECQRSINSYWSGMFGIMSDAWS